MNPVLTRRIAVIQAYLLALDRTAHLLTDISDMQALRRLKIELATYITKKSSEGVIPPDPLAETLGEIQQVSNALNQANSIYHELSRLEENIKTPQTRSLSLYDVQVSLGKVEAAKATLPDKLGSVRSLCLPPAASPERGLLTAESVQVAIQLMPDSPIHRLPSRELFQFMHGQGSFYESVLTHLEEVRLHCMELQRLHRTQQLKLSITLGAAARGNFRTAQQAVASLTQTFNDLDYDAADEIANKCNSWFEKIQKVVAHFESDLIKWRSFRAFANPILVARERSDALARLRFFRNEITQFRDSLPSPPTTEFECEAHDLINDTLPQLQSLYRKTAACFGWSQLKTWSQLLAILLLLGAVPTSAYYWAKSGAFSPLSASVTTQVQPAPVSVPTAATAQVSRYGSLDLPVGGCQVRATLIGNDKTVFEGTTPAKVDNLLPGDYTVLFSPLDPVPAAPVTHTVQIIAGATATATNPLPFSTVKEWLGSHYTNKIGMKLLWVREGFWVSSLPLTTTQFRKVLPLDNPGLSASEHVRYVTLDEAKRFCDKLTAMDHAMGVLPTDFRYAVPTEREWGIFAMSAIEQAKQKRAFADGSPLPSSLDRIPVRRFMCYDDALDGEWLDTLYNSVETHHLIAGVKDAEGARTQPDRRDMVGFRTVVVPKDSSRSTQRLKRDIGMSILSVEQKNEVVWVDDNSPAHRAGITQGDLLQLIDGRPVLGTEYYNAFLRTLVPGSKIPIRIQKTSGETTDVTVDVR